jgi:hypothetical protein
MAWVGGQVEGRRMPDDTAEEARTFGAGLLYVH